MVPFYNCENYISRAISSFGLSHFQIFEKVILIDNASTDESLKIAKSAVNRHFLSEKFVLLKNRENYGLGGSFKVGLERAASYGYSHLCFFHGDGQARLADINQFVEAFKENPQCSAVMGSRFMTASQREGYSFQQTAANYFFNLLYSFFTRKWISDIGSGLNVYRVTDLNLSFVKQLSNHFVFNAELLLGLISQRKEIIFVPISWKNTGLKTLSKNFAVAKKIFVILLSWRLGSLKNKESANQVLWTDEMI